MSRPDVPAVVVAEACIAKALVQRARVEVGRGGAHAGPAALLLNVLRLCFTSEAEAIRSFEQSLAYLEHDRRNHSRNAPPRESDAVLWVALARGTGGNQRRREALFNRQAWLQTAARHVRLQGERMWRPGGWPIPGPAVNEAKLCAQLVGFSGPSGDASRRLRIWWRETAYLAAQSLRGQLDVLDDACDPE